MSRQWNVNPQLWNEKGHFILLFMTYIRANRKFLSLLFFFFNCSLDRIKFFFLLNINSEINHGIYLKTASSISWGLFVAPITSMRSSLTLCSPSNWHKNSVFSLRLASCSPSLRSDKRLSISSTKMMEGWWKIKKRIFVRVS